MFMISKPIISLTNLICWDNNLTIIVDSFRQSFLAESRNNHIVVLVGSTEKHIIFYIFYISFNLCFPCIILRKLISSCVELDKITFILPYFPYLLLLPVMFCSSLFWLYFPVESAFRWWYIVYPDGDLFVPLALSQIGLCNLIRINNFLCILSFDLIHMSCIYILTLRIDNRKQ
jgi:hypothetical protein